MWLFTGRYGQYGPAICAIALGVAAIGIAFLVVAARLVRRSDVSAGSVVGVILAVMAAAVIGEVQAFGEPVFVSEGLNKGAALMLAIVGLLLGAGGVSVSSKRRLLGVLLLVAASGLLFGDVVGWIRRSAGPSYRSGALHALPVVRMVNSEQTSFSRSAIFEPITASRSRRGSRGGTIH